MKPNDYNAQLQSRLSLGQKVHVASTFPDEAAQNFINGVAVGQYRMCTIPQLLNHINSFYNTKVEGQEVYAINLSFLKDLLFTAGLIGICTPDETQVPTTPLFMFVTRVICEYKAQDDMTITIRVPSTTYANIWKKPSSIADFKSCYGKVLDIAEIQYEKNIVAERKKREAEEKARKEKEEAKRKAEEEAEAYKYQKEYFSKLQSIARSAQNEFEKVFDSDMHVSLSKEVEDAWGPYLPIYKIVGGGKTGPIIDFLVGEGMLARNGKKVMPTLFTPHAWAKRREGSFNWDFSKPAIEALHNQITGDNLGEKNKKK